MIGVDYNAVNRVAGLLRKTSVELDKLDLFDERYYPPRDMDTEIVLRYFIVMVAMDHRLSRPGKPYEACLSDGCYHGADLLYRLGSLKLREDPGFFSPEKLAEITIDEVREWLSVGSVQPVDIEVRTYLLRDLGVKLLKLYDGSVLELIKRSSNRVKGDLLNPGLVDNLKVFKAFEDPVEKKALLFVKFIIKRGLFKPVDQLDVAVDNHLTRISYRLGLVMVSGDLWRKIKEGVEVSVEEDVLLRLVVRRAYRELASKSRIDPCLIDDYFWIMGRTICIRDKPLCDKCLFKNICLARRNNVFMVNEHVFYNTWYY